MPLTPRLAAALREHAARYRLAIYHGERTPFVFHHTHDRYRARAGTRMKSFRGGFKNALRRAELPPTRLHDLRHRRVTVWLAEGASPVLVQEAVGHAQIQTTMGYRHLAREHLRALVAEPAPAPAAEGRMA